MRTTRPLLAGLVLLTLLAGCGSEDETADGFGSPEECVAALVEVSEGEVSAAELVERCGVSAADAEAAVPVTSTPNAALAAELEPTTSVPPTPAATVPVTAPEPAPTAIMPDIPCGTDLQLAQDMVQEAGVFLTRSVDATGEDRYQVMDRNWTVVDVHPAAGTPIGEDEAVFYVVKDDEFTGC